jgi:hypothetical protein
MSHDSGTGPNQSSDRVVFLPSGDHHVAAITVIVDCSCGACFEGDTEAMAIKDWQQHVEDETHTGET